jgi:two-component system chemotaxis family response regulator WspR
VSIGVATVTPGVGSNSRQLIQEADKGLYQAKHNGRNRVSVGQ